MGGGQRDGCRSFSKTSARLVAREFFMRRACLELFWRLGPAHLLLAIEKFGWRWGFGIGALPALLTLWIRWRLREPEEWVQARELAKKDNSKETGRLLDLFRGNLLRRTIVGVTLAAAGLATFWGVHVFGKDLMRRDAERSYLRAEQHFHRCAESGPRCRS